MHTSNSFCKFVSTSLVTQQKSQYIHMYIHTHIHIHVCINCIAVEYVMPQLTTVRNLAVTIEHIRLYWSI